MDQKRLTPEEQEELRRRRQRRARRQAAERKRRRRRRRRILLLCLAVLFLALIAAAAAALSGSRKAASDASGDVQESSDAAPEEASADESGSAQESADAGPVTFTMSFVGDCTLGTDEYFGTSGRVPEYYENYGADYFFENVRSVFEADDITVVNMEGVLTEETTRKENEEYCFKGDPEYVAILSGSSVEAANLANNHSYDYGEQSYLDTIEILEEAGISHFGFEDVAILDVQGVSVGLVGIFEVDASEDDDVAAWAKEGIETAQEAGADIVVVSFHWGIETDSVPESKQIELAHQAIDDGADLVIGHHPHVLQGIEYYNGKVIAYSL